MCTRLCICAHARLFSPLCAKVCGGVEAFPLPQCACSHALSSSLSSLVSSLQATGVLVQAWSGPDLSMGGILRRIQAPCPCGRVRLQSFQLGRIHRCPGDHRAALCVCDGGIPALFTRWPVQIQGLTSMSTLCCCAPGPFLRVGSTPFHLHRGHHRRSHPVDVC